jgi:hypothetical protein
MSSLRREKKLVGPWRSAHALIWLIGLAILAWTDGWWPGILLLIGLSLVLEAALRRHAPQAFQEVAQTPEDSDEDEAPLPPPPAAPPVLTVPEKVGKDEWLPTTCPKCGGPTRGSEVRWTGPSSADCPFCGTNLPLKRT